MTLTTEFLTLHNLSYDTELCTNKAKEPISIGLAIDTLLDSATTTEAKSKLQAKSTFTTDLKTFLDFIPRAGKDWKARILYSLGLKYCGGCTHTKSLEEFNHRKQGNGYTPQCSSCNTTRTKTYYENNKEKVNAYISDYNKTHREEINTRARLKYNNDQEYRSRRLASQKKYYDANVEMFKARSAEYRAALYQRTVKWADFEAILEIYKNCPEGHHVDHIIPLNGKLVSGLHVENNLQYLTAEENIAKGNKYEIAI